MLIRNDIFENYCMFYYFVYIVLYIDFNDLYNFDILYILVIIVLDW